MTDDEKMICKIECDASGKKKHGDSVTLTNKRLYKTGINRLGIEHRKAVSLDAVSGAEWGTERFLRVPVIGLVFFALCCVLSAYLLPHDKLLRTILGIAVLALGAVVLITCIVIYFRFTVRAITVYYSGGRMHVLSPGISDEDAEEFVMQLLDAAEKARASKLGESEK